MSDIRVQTTVPVMTFDNQAAEAIEWYATWLPNSRVASKFYARDMMGEAYKGTETLAHGELAVNGSMVYMHDILDKHHKVSPIEIFLHMESTEQIDATFKACIDNGGKGLDEPRNQPWGAYYAEVQDKFGHVWSLYGDVKPEAGAAAPKIGKLFAKDWYSSSPVKHLIHELGLESRIEFVEPATDDELKKAIEPYNAAKLVPTFVVYKTSMQPEFVLTESSAIMMYLLEHHDFAGHFHPLPTSNNRAKFLELMFWAPATAYPTYVPYLMQTWMPEDKQNKELMATHKKKWVQITAWLEGKLGDSQFFVGDKFTAADAALGYTLVGGMYAKLPLPPKCTAYFGRLSERPAFQKSYPPMDLSTPIEGEGVEHADKKSRKSE